MKTRLKMVILGASLAFGLASAAPMETSQNTYMGGSITREYRASDLKQAYGILDIAMGEIWVLNLPDDVVDVITSREGVLQFSQRGQRVVIGATASTGSYPILVMTADSVYFFQARLAPSRGGGVRNIIVRADQAPEPEQQIPGFPTQAAPTNALPQTSMPVATPASPTTTRTPASTPAAASLPASTARTSPATTSTPTRAVTSQVTPQPAASPVPVPVSLPARADVEFRALTNGQQTRVYYRITNSGSVPVTFDERRLTLNGVQGLGATDAVVRVNPGETKYGQVDLTTAPTSINAQWQGSSVDGQAAAEVMRTVTVERLGAS
ncbi:hypothetical protein [Deinococcus soli (ex Cha et al. 2016)]|uniref:hypothetical protein n=1 Tax=Deinococcus soli (ex Cha et al. 2016) TaxID=1309411 RepID=UPI0016679FD4|nr:hypothetical protein [Deinococcus soli (ex Cha et al. 2016)]GGB61248.1 hypothetical protein GCM10008019_16530 [Deinococcus soli (ex Cha et al. 2016)]